MTVDKKHYKYAKTLSNIGRIYYIDKDKEMKYFEDA